MIIPITTGYLEWSAGVTIRHATLADAEAVLDIYSPYVRDTCITFDTEVPVLSAFVEQMRNVMNSFPFLVCEKDGRIAGYAYASNFRERAAYKYSASLSVYVASESQRQGIGGALYSYLIDLLTKQGIYTVFASITLPNESSIGLHRSLGFNMAGTYHKVGYKQGKWLDVAWYEKQIREYDNPEESFVCHD